MNNNPLYIITGPTASGKTAKAVALAKAIDGEIISADSRQIYRGMDIGTDRIQRYFIARQKYHIMRRHGVICRKCDKGYRITAGTRKSRIAPRTVRQDFARINSYS